MDISPGDNSSNESSTPPCYNEYCLSDEDYIDMVEQHVQPNAGEWILVVIFIILFIVGLVGNFLVCYAVIKNSQMRTVTNLFIMNLAIADFMVILICLPSSLLVDVSETWFFGEVMCKIFLYLQVSHSFWFLWIFVVLFVVVHPFDAILIHKIIYDRSEYFLEQIKYNVICVTRILFLFFSLLIYNKLRYIALFFICLLFLQWYLFDIYFWQARYRCLLLSININEVLDWWNNKYIFFFCYYIFVVLLNVNIMGLNDAFLFRMIAYNTKNEVISTYEIFLMLCIQYYYFVHRNMSWYVYIIYLQNVY